MKNIHILPTDKPSILYNCFSELEIGEFVSTRDGLLVTNQNIYITSDEEIKEGDWVLFLDTNEILKIGNEPNQCGLDERVDKNNSKKIILTTDVDLIKDGVHAIDDEFLEWFVKNPSCEMVEVDYKYDTNLKPIFDSFGNKVLRIKIPTESENLSQIIIPKEVLNSISSKNIPSEFNDIVNKEFFNLIEEPKKETFKNYPVIIVRNDDKEEFIHLSNGMYRTKWGILHDSISSTPLESFDKSKFTFYYE
jgi:hypothetical protein